MYQVQGSSDLAQGVIESGNEYAKNRTKWKRPQLMVWSHNEGVFGNSETTQGNTYPWGREGEDFIITSDHNRSALSVDQLRIENRMRMVGGNMRSYYTGQKVTLNCSWNLLPSRAYQERVMTDQYGNLASMAGTTPYSQWPYGQPKKIVTTEWTDREFFAKLIGHNATQVAWNVGVQGSGFFSFNVYRSEEATPIFTYDSFQHSLEPDNSFNYLYIRQENEASVQLRFVMTSGDWLNPTTYEATVDFSWEAQKINAMPTSEFTADGGAGGADLLTWYRETHGPFWVFLSYDNYPNFEGNTDVWNQFDKYSDRYMMYFTSFNYSVEKRGLYDMWNVSVSLEEA